MTRSPRGRGAAAQVRRDAAPWLIAAFILVAFADVFRLGYFSDDFIFLDAASRFPFFDVLSGRHGIWPWYRPLSRELFFGLAALAGGAGPFVARALSLATLAFTADALRRILSRHIGERAARGAMLLFLAHALTRFLAGWLSGFQDLLALALALGALRFHREGRFALAVACAGLAPLAKESGALAFVWIALDEMLEPQRRPAPRVITAYAGALIAAGAIHVGARLTWAPHAPASPGVAELRALPALALQALVPWVTPPGRAGVLAWMSAALAAILAAMLLRPEGARERGGGTSQRFISGALVVSLLPALLPALLTHDTPHSHFFFAAIPWACALVSATLARRAPAVALRWALPLAVGALVWNQSARPIDLDVPEGWAISPWGWESAQRIEARTRRMEMDVRRLLAVRPESLEVVYGHVPAGALFQTGDGPATRVALGDRTLRATRLDDLPAGALDRLGRPIVILDYDPNETHRLFRLEPTDSRLLPMTVVAILDHRTSEADNLASFRLSGDRSSALPGYLRAMNRLVDSGPAIARAQFERDGLADSAGAASRAIGALRPDADAALRVSLARPLSAAAHRAAADSLEAAELPVLEALELAVSIALDPRRGEEALRLARMLAPRDPAAARRAYEQASGPLVNPTIREAASAELARLGAGR